MNHRTQNHSGVLKATVPNLYQVENTGVQTGVKTEMQMPINYIDANLADHRIDIQMASTVVQMPASEQSNFILEADLANRRVEIERDDRLKFTLQEWENTLERRLTTIQYRRTCCINVKNELYQLIGFYIVFQGVVLTAVAQASLLKCETCWGPASLSLLASIATVPAVQDRLKDYNVLKNNLFWDVEHSNVISEKIGMLKRKGASFDFAQHARVKEETHDEENKKRQLFKAQWRKNHIVRWLATLLLCVFSSVILSCCYIIPCWDIIDKNPTGQIGGS